MMAGIAGMAVEGNHGDGRHYGNEVNDESRCNNGKYGNDSNCGNDGKYDNYGYDGSSGNDGNFGNDFSDRTVTRCRTY